MTSIFVAASYVGAITDLDAGINSLKSLNQLMQDVLKHQ